ncbi:MAG TPA: TMEM165/GDT1 family protein [Planctomycetota bacterium]|nr:TMEM165/GDT1 family protein [Planctomycetota bacterium]
MMDLKIILTTFAAVFLAELGDKTQLATFCLAGNCSRASVFIGAASALVLTSLIAVLLGGLLQQQSFIKPIWIRRIAAAVFIIIGIVMLFGKEGAY